MSDLISRQAALDAIQERANEIDSVYSAFWEGLIIAQDIVRNLPSAEPEWKKGVWEKISMNLSGYEQMYYKHDCSYYVYEAEYNFCPYCGTEMSRGE